MHLGEKLKLYRKKKDLDQPEMAAQLGIGYRTYQEIERTGIITKANIKEKVFQLLEDKQQATDTQKFAGEDKDKTIYNLSEAQIIQARAILILAGKINSGGPGGAFLDGEDEPKGPSQEDLKPPSGNTKDKGKRKGT